MKTGKKKMRWRKKTYLALHQKEKRDSYIFYVFIAHIKQRWT